MFEKFGFGKPHTTPEQRLRLEAAIRDRDPVRFREVLRENPPPGDQVCFYGILTWTDAGMMTTLVDRHGHPFDGPDAVIPAGAPVDLLNMDIFPNEVVVTIDGEVYRAPVAVPHLPTDPPDTDPR